MATTNIKYVRVFRGMSQEEAAGKLGVSLATLRNWEQGKNDPSRENLMKLREVYRVTADQLLIPGYPMPGQEPVSADLGDDEKELLENYSAMTEERREVFMQLSRCLTDQN